MDLKDENITYSIYFFQIQPNQEKKCYPKRVQNFIHKNTKTHFSIFDHSNHSKFSGIRSNFSTIMCTDKQFYCIKFYNKIFYDFFCRIIINSAIQGMTSSSFHQLSISGFWIHCKYDYKWVKQTKFLLAVMYG